MRPRGFTLLIYGLMLLALLTALGGIYAKGYYAGKAVVRGEWDAANAKARAEEAARAHEAATKLEAANAKRRIVYRTIREQVEKVVDRVEYRDRPCLDARGVCLANAAIGGKGADTCQPHEPLSGSDPVAGWYGQGGAALDHADR